jgi:hypothetical protein
LAQTRRAAGLTHRAFADGNPRRFVQDRGWITAESRVVPALVAAQAVIAGIERILKSPVKDT